MKKAKVQEISIPHFICNECHTSVYACYECDDYFELGQEIYCGEDGNHYHKDCGEEHERELKEKD